MGGGGMERGDGSGNDETYSTLGNQNQEKSSKRSLPSPPPETPKISPNSKKIK